MTSAHLVNQTELGRLRVLTGRLMSAHPPENPENRCPLSFLASPIAHLSCFLFLLPVPTSRNPPFQADAVVGHNDSAASPSHFIAINLNGRLEVIEFPGGDASKARIYIGPQLFGSGEQLTPVTLSFVGVNGNHRPDMILHVQDTRLVYINENGGFRPATPDELHAVERYLQQHGQ
jgi:hypothetical protein